MQRTSFEQPGSSKRPVERIYAAEAKQDRAELEQELPRLRKLQRARKWRQALVLLTVLVLLAGGAWRGFTQYQHRQLINQVPASIRASVDFPIYIPAADRLKLRPGSISYSAGNLIFTIGDGESKLIVTEQAKPTDFDVNKFAGITATTAVVSRLGAGVRGKVANRTIVILATDKTLVTCVALSDAALDEMDLAVTSLIKLD